MNWKALRDRLPTECQQRSSTRQQQQRREQAKPPATFIDRRGIETSRANHRLRFGTLDRPATPLQDCKKSEEEDCWSKCQRKKNRWMHGSSPNDSVNFILDYGTRDPLQAHLGNEVAKASPKTVSFSSQRGGNGPGRSHDSSLTLIQLNRPFLGEFSIGFSDSVEMNSELGSDTSYGRQCIPWRKNSTPYVHTNLIHNLPVDRDRGVGYQLEARVGHLTTVRRLHTVSNKNVCVSNSASEHSTVEGRASNAKPGSDLGNRHISSFEQAVDRGPYTKRQKSYAKEFGSLV